MIRIAAIALALLTLTACEYDREHGECVGVDDDKNPALEYEVSTRNAILAVLGAEMALIPPVVVLLEATYCPVGPSRAAE